MLRFARRSNEIFEINNSLTPQDQVNEAMQLKKVIKECIIERTFFVSMSTL